MWWLLNFQYILLSDSKIAIYLGLPSLDVTIKQFLLLGVIPGTDIFITFNWLIVASWAGFFAWLATKAFPEALHIIKEQQKLLGKLNDIDKLSL